MGLARITLSVAALTLANLVPLVGVFFFHWDAAAIVLLYWTENLVLGGYNILKMIVLKPKNAGGHLGKLFIIPFFCVHYGAFCAVHGFFLLAFFHLGGESTLPTPGHDWPGPLVFVQLLVSVVTRLWESHPEGMQWSVLMLTLSHGVSFVQNFLRGGEYAALSLDKLMSQPYKRIVLTHIAIIAGGVPVMALGSPVPLLVILIALKIGMDLWLYTRSHKAAPGKAGNEAGVEAADD
jgi:hypothetical protein